MDKTRGDIIAQFPMNVNISEDNKIRLIIDGIKAFQTRANHLLSLETPTMDDLKQCLQNGVGIDIELPELDMLIVSLERLRWLAQVQSYLSVDEGSQSVWTFDFLSNTIQNGERLKEQFQIDESLLTLKHIKATVERWEERATRLLNTDEKVEAKRFLELYTDSKKIRMHLPSLPAVRDLVRNANDWLAKAKAFQVQDEYLFQDELESMIRKGEGFPILLNELKYLKTHAQEAREFKVKVARIFLRRRSTVSLVAAFIPRTEINCIARREKKVKFNPDLTISREEYAELLSLTPESVKDVPTLIKALNVKQNEEIEKMKHVRNVNAAKRVGENEAARYCVCHSRWESGIMIQCHLCFEYFHPACLPLLKNLVPPTENISSLPMAIYQISCRNLRFFCPGCCRTRRPTMFCLLELYNVLKMIVVRIPECEVIEFLMQRAMSWVYKAREFMHREVIIAAMRLIEPLGVLYVKDIPPPFLDAYNETGTGDHIAVWHPGSGATITSDVVDQRKVIDGEKGTKLWNEQLKEFIGKASLDARNCTVDPNSKEIRRAVSHPAGTEVRNYETPASSPFSPRLAYSPFTPLVTPLSESHHRMTGNRDPMPQNENEMALLSRPSGSRPSESRETALGSQASSRNVMQNHPASPSYSQFIENGYNKSPPHSRIRRSLLNGDSGEEAVLRGPRITLSDDLISELDTLLMEADLMEVTIVEAMDLYRLREFTKAAEPVLDISSIEENLKLESLLKGLRGKRPSVEVVETEAVRQLSPSPGLLIIDSPVVPKKELKRRRRSGNNAGTGARRISKRRRVAKSEETCAFPKCTKPMGFIDWLQCEYGCEQWFHFVCVGLKNDDVEKIGRYCCTMCLGNKNQLDQPAPDDEDGPLLAILKIEPNGVSIIDS